MHGTYAVRVPASYTTHRGTTGAAKHPTTPFNLLGYADLTSPWVAGLFWVFPPPDAALYWEGVRMLKAPWDAKLGFNCSGTPHHSPCGKRGRHGVCGQPARSPSRR